MNVKIIQDWEKFYNYSPLRNAVLSWYPISKTFEVLDAGCGQGSLTGFLCDKAAAVDAVDKDASCIREISNRYLQETENKKHNLRIFNKDLFEFYPDKKYDLIILMEVLENVPGREKELLCRLKSFLKPEGELIIGFRNRFALRYQCGLVDEYVYKTGAQMDISVPLHTSAEVQEMVSESGLSIVKCYYPLPDLLFTQAVYSDEFMPEGSIRDRLITYDPFTPGNSQKARLEYESWDKIILNNMLPVCSNAYLLSCRNSEYKESDKPYITGAILSADREKKSAFSTIFYSNDTVIKKPLYKEGFAILQEMTENAAEIKKSGLSIVEQKFVKHDEEAYLQMPYIKRKRLLEHIRTLILNEPEQIIPVFRKLYQDILRAGNADMPFHYTDDWIRAETPVLKTGYIDMIPLNAFVDDNKYIYFDQEFKMKNCPAKYIIYRAIRYTWLHISEAETVFPVQKIKEYFGLLEDWEKYTQTEDLFTEKNRNRKDHQQVYEWAWSEKPYNIGFIMGVFDLFHVGHLNLLERAKQKCNFLRIGVLSDALVYKYKNILPEIKMEDRIRILKALEVVDDVIAVEGDYVSKIAEWYKNPYDCFFSGDDHSDNEYWEKEREELKKLGAEMEFFSYTKEINSTMLRSRAHRKFDDE